MPGLDGSECWRRRARRCTWRIRCGGIWLDRLPLPQPYADKVASLRARTGVLDGEIARLEDQAAAALAGDPGYAAIRALPGISPVTDARPRGLVLPAAAGTSRPGGRNGKG